ncbi:hypothetical protein RRG08_018161 [Elysia crispata]|uniref:Uncharacterized protein n=1 Tax=Elysia crispata TaxID=231223 RepID=A0AAE1AYD4_9GAST|nr:hypothetical protein RRG08_018161 [Elysia crispata]
MADWEFPVYNGDLQEIIRTYLEESSKPVPAFKNKSGSQQPQSLPPASCSAALYQDICCRLMLCIILAVNLDAQRPREHQKEPILKALYVEMADDTMNRNIFQAFQDTHEADPIARATMAMKRFINLTNALRFDVKDTSSSRRGQSISPEDIESPEKPSPSHSLLPESSMRSPPHPLPPPNLLWSHPQPWRWVTGACLVL